jgi:hypothetical protein
MIEFDRGGGAGIAGRGPAGVIRVNHDSIDEALGEVYVGRASRINFEGGRERAPGDVPSDEVDPPRCLLALASRAALRKTPVTRLFLRRSDLAKAFDRPIL